MTRSYLTYPPTWDWTGALQEIFQPISQFTLIKMQTSTQTSVYNNDKTFIPAKFCLQQQRQESQKVLHIYKCLTKNVKFSTSQKSAILSYRKKRFFSKKRKNASKSWNKVIICRGRWWSLHFSFAAYQSAVLKQVKIISSL